MNTDTLSERVLRGLASVSHLSVDLMCHCVDARDPVTADLANRINNQVNSVSLQLEEKGVALPSIEPDAYEVPLHLLDTPANRRLLALLEETYQAAQRVDNERGHEPDEGVYSQWIGELLANVRMEIFGPGGGRE